MENFSFNYNGKIIVVENIGVCESLSSKFIGLMFKSKTNSNALLFKFNKPSRQAIHSLFVRLPFIAAWLDNKNNVLEFKIVKPWKFYVKPKIEFVKLLEVPLTKKYTKIIDILLVKRKI